MKSAVSGSSQRAYWLKKLHEWHWISSAICLIGMLLFAFTGITLNHAGQIESKPRVETREGQMPPELLPKIQHWDTALAQHWAQTLKVSTEALSYALLDAQLIDQGAAKLIRSTRVPMAEKVDPEAPEYLNATQLNRRLQLLERGLSDYYVDLCFEAHKQGLISAGRLGEALMADHKETREISILYGRSIVNEL